MSTKPSKNQKTNMNDVLELISRFEAGDFSAPLADTDDQNLKPLVEKLNSAAKTLAAQANRNKEFQFISDTLGIGFWKLDLVTNELEWDQNMYRLYGIDPRDFNGAFDAWEKSLSQSTKDRALKEIEAAVNGEKDFDTIFQVVHKTGKLQEIRAKAFVLRDENGKALKMWGINVDRNQEAQAERERDANSAFLKAVFDNVPTMIFVKSCKDDFKYSFINQYGEKLLDMPASHFIGKSDFDIFSKEQAARNRESDKIIAQSKAVYKNPVSTLIKTKSGERNLATIKVPTYSKDGQPEFIIGISTDITEELAISAKLEIERAKSIRNAKLASLGEMSAGIAHEINNPLAIIDGVIRLLPKFVHNPEKLNAKIETLAKSCHRISKIVSGLKKFSRSGENTPYNSRALSEIVKDSMALTEAKAKHHSIPVLSECSTAAEVLCNEIEIEQVLINLINNAIDAVKNNSEKWVKVTVYAEASSVVLRVTDAGRGIREDVRAKLFEPFFTTKNVGEGTGLGLSIAKGILDEHNATIAVMDDSPNTCFEIRFPLPKASENVA